MINDPHENEGARRASRTYGSGQTREERTSAREDLFKRLLDARQSMTPESHPLSWARISMELGSLVMIRGRGGMDANCRLAIEFYTDALRVYKREAQPREWAECQRGIGNAFRHLADGKDRSTKKQASRHYELALTVGTKASWPELWHIIQLELSMLHGHYARITGDTTERELAEEYLARAVDIDRKKHAELYDSIARSHAAFTRLLELRLRRRGASDRGVKLIPGEDADKVSGTTE